MSGFSALMNRDKREIISLPTTWEHREMVAVYEPGSRLSPDTRPASTLILDFQLPEL